ncbi:hypothetical protein DFH09DRAFT_1290255 [Mycena vulgaris]|nr:hypothetical protein DFH09DRAFT_1290255 [Mycena vulgaris]
MAHTLSTLSSGIQTALMRLMRFLFGLGHRGNDLESGNSIPGIKVAGTIVKVDAVPETVVPKFKPDIAGVPALVLASMAVSAALTPQVLIDIKAVVAPRSLVIPIIVVHPPAEVLFTSQDQEAREAAVSKAAKAERVPFAELKNTGRRVYGKAPPLRKPRLEKENIREHPNAPRRPQLRALPPRVQTPVLPASGPFTQPVVNSEVAVERVKSAEPGSSEWADEKAMRLQEARDWSEAVKARRRLSLPTPPLPPSSARTPFSATSPPPLPRRASAPARLSLQERLKRAVSGFAVPAAPAVHVAPLWGDLYVSFVIEDEEDDDNKEVEFALAREHGPPGTMASVLDDAPLPALSPSSSSSSSTDSITSVLDALEVELQSPAWLALQSLADLEVGPGHTEAHKYDGDGAADDGEDSDVGSDHWSDVVSLDDYA